MAVIVHHQGVTQHLGIQPRPGGPEGPQADGDVEQAVGMGAHGRQRRDLVFHGQTSIVKARDAAGLRGAARQRAKRSDQHATIQHQLLPF